MNTKYKLMKNFALITLSFLLSFQLSSQESKGYELKFQIKNYPDSVAHLSYFYGKGQFYRDTALVNNKGEFVFEDKEDTLEHGMYSVLSTTGKLFDFVVDDQQFSVSSNHDDIVQSLEVEGSKENKIFFEYFKFLNSRQKKSKELRDKLETAEGKEKEKIIAELDQLDEEVANYLEDFHKKNEGTLPSNFLKAVKYPEVPENPNPSDSSFAYRYFKAHFFDNFDFTDGRLVRTNTFHEKIMYYLDKLTYQQADSIIKSVDYILEKSQQSPQLFKYALSFLTSHYERSERMGMDAVFVHLVKNYFAKGMAEEWYSEKNLKKLVEKAETLDPLLIGKKAPNIVVKDTAQKKFLQLYDVEAKYTIVYIWSPDCGHCKKATPELLKMYHKYRDMGVDLKVFAVGNEYENEAWINFINQHKLDFINGSDGGDFTSNFRQLYDVFSTPQTYLLDEDKIILAKKISIEGLDKMIEFLINNEEK